MSKVQRNPFFNYIAFELIGRKRACALRIFSVIFSNAAKTVIRPFAVFVTYLSIILLRIINQAAINVKDHSFFLRQSTEQTVLWKFKRKYRKYNFFANLYEDLKATDRWILNQLLLLTTKMNGMIVNNLRLPAFCNLA